jgi:hypothetical protein
VLELSYGSNQKKDPLIKLPIVEPKICALYFDTGFASFRMESGTSSNFVPPWTPTEISFGILGEVESPKSRVYILD